MKTNNVYFVDMDGTLVETDAANNKAYAVAMKELLGIDLPCLPKMRWSRCKIQRMYSQLSVAKLDALIARKQELYPQFLNLTRVNEEMKTELLYAAANNCKIYLVTNSSTLRAMQVLAHHDLKGLFHDFVCRDVKKCMDYNKYQEAIEKLSVELHRITVFENEEVEMENARRAGIATENIIPIEINF